MTSTRAAANVSSILGHSIASRAIHTLKARSNALAQASALLFAADLVAPFRTIAIAFSSLFQAHLYMLEAQITGSSFDVNSSFRIPLSTIAALIRISSLQLAQTTTTLVEAVITSSVSLAPIFSSNFASTNQLLN